MSHITNVSTTITKQNLPLAKQAALNLGLKVNENGGIVKAWDGTTVNSVMVFEPEYGKYHAGLVFNQATGTYDIVADWEMAPALRSAMGENGVMFLDEYNLEVVKQQAKRLGLPISVKRDNGEIRVTMGVKANA